MVDLSAFPEQFVVAGEMFEPFAEVVDLELEQSCILRVEDVLIDGRQFLETDAVGLKGDDLIDLVVEVLQLFPQLTVGHLVFLHQTFLFPVHHHLYYIAALDQINTHQSIMIIVVSFIIYSPYSVNSRSLFLRRNYIFVPADEG
jgi:hypothetical protein